MGFLQLLLFFLKNKSNLLLGSDNVKGVHNEGNAKTDEHNHEHKSSEHEVNPLRKGSRR